MGFIGCYPITRGGCKIYQPIGGGTVCDESTYIDSTGAEVFVPFVGDPLEFATGAIRLIGDTSPDIITAPISYDASLDDTFSLDQLTNLLTNGDEWLEMNDSVSGAYIQFNYNSASDRLRVLVSNGTALVASDFAGVNAVGSRRQLGFVASGLVATKQYLATVDGVSGGDPEVIDMTGVIFDSIIIGSNSGESAMPNLDLYALNSSLLGNTNFIGRIPYQGDPNANKFYSDAVVPVEYTLFDKTPFGSYFPWTIGAWPTSYLKEDKQTINGACVTIPAGQEVVTHLGIPVTNNGVVVTHDI